MKYRKGLRFSVHEATRRKTAKLGETTEAPVPENRGLGQLTFFNKCYV